MFFFHDLQLVVVLLEFSDKCETFYLADWTKWQSEDFAEECNLQSSKIECFIPILNLSFNVNHFALFYSPAKRL